MQLCKNKGMYDVFMQLWKYIDLQPLKYQLCKCKSMKIFMYKIYKFAGLQIFKCVRMPLCMYTSIEYARK